MIIIEKEDEVSEEGAKAAPGRTRASAPGSRRQVILVVEDSESDRDLYGGLLWYNGFDVFHAADGETGIERALALRPDLVLLDIVLPGMSGLDVARRLKDEGLDAPVILLSARSRDEVGELETDLGVVQYLEKPIDPFAVLKEVVRQIGYATPGSKDG